ncbi:vWA domain-containing protein [Deinococcus sp. Leaf326]|uniref:vWA domain-containing protein n=1 Tax=Deinococcus sp. Leaf326 TaxID=1736338 RepID=UPI0006F306F6|nr:vWA domain-containing protein [Deinococcus sp. Leaf326]KQR25572.1 hypothetical protein ASF71_19000 [Deinococcus sp. Leaf326]
MTPSAHWWQAPHIQDWSRQTWRYYSWRPTYQLTLTTSEPTAYVNMKAKQVVCNPEYPYPPLLYRSGVRGLPSDIRAFHVAYLESLIAHEAGHTHHSGDLPAGLLGQLVNIIEDERMERLMAQTFPQLQALFHLAADADAAHSIAGGGTGGDLIRGCLLHRFTWHHPTWAYIPDQADAHPWPRVCTILEDAWTAPDFADVITAARDILNILGLPADAPRRDDLAHLLDGTGQQVLSSDERAQEDPQGAGSGKGNGGGRPTRPIPEQLPTATTLELKAQLTGLSRQLAGLLQAKGKPSHVQQSRDRGRYRADRALTGSERCFDQRVGAEKLTETHVRLAVDISGSMKGDNMDAARELTFALTYAAQLAGVPLIAVAFDEQIVPLVDPGQPGGDTALNTVAQLHARGSTVLSPALEALWRPVLPGQSLTFVITDGGLCSDDYQDCQRLRGKHKGMIIPVLLGDAPRIQAQYEAAFGRCVALRDGAHLLTYFPSFLRAFLK